ncbi:transcription factor E2F7 isoform X1 [Rhinichthys klamathensis goyatoka]|uniref:transcription factor E2F7 isoform X1 n=1 Tax=Rhinichthys klamathensis goyatoka TaxID=3034132 RepID=UPI0024B583C4|nr:transcription factor E2F7 isoform X1 [Rhinichthys klamathensis goyatoka]
MEMKCLTLKDLRSVRTLVNKTSSDDPVSLNDHKENICTDRRKTTPLKCESVTAAVSGHRRVSSPDIIHITPIKHTERAHPDPWTPTANLKMLISAASPDIRDREMKKTLFRPIENEEKAVEEEEDEEELDDSCQYEALDDSERRPSRKQKSLGLLCQKFLALYPDYPETSASINISLDEVAYRLGVERRRIYDIVNVLESLMLVSRMAKNMYVWHGRPRLPQTLQELHRAGREQGYHLQMDPREGSSPYGAHHMQNTHAASSRRKDKSLRIMSQKFVMLFLVSKTQTVTLDTAAKILIEEGQDESSHSKYKTKVRRLYDIANVLTSLNLIKKLHVREEKSRKPVFKWIGPADFHSSDSDDLRVSEAQISASVTGTGERREKMTRHSSFQVIPAPPVNQRRISSAPSTPQRHSTDEPVDYSRKSVNSTAVCQLQFGDSVQASGSAVGPAVPLQADVPFASLPFSAQFAPHQLAYLSGLPQTPVFMVYSGHVPEGINQRSPVSGHREGHPKKRERQEEEEDDQAAKRSKRSVSIESETGETESSRSSARRSPICSREGSPWDEASFGPMNEEDAGTSSPKDALMSSHYLYVPNTAGLNGLNFLMPAGHTQGGVPAVAMPYFLVPSPLITGAMPASSAEGVASSGLSFSMPTMLSPAQFVMAGGAFNVAEKLNTPEHHGHRIPVATFSPQGPRVQESPQPAQTQTPVTPKEAALGSKSFFETPGAFGSLTGQPAARKRGSAQRRLDIGHTAAN